MEDTFFCLKLNKNKKTVRAGENPLEWTTLIILIEITESENRGVDLGVVYKTSIG